MGGGARGGREGGGGGHGSDPSLRPGLQRTFLPVSPAFLVSPVCPVSPASVSSVYLVSPVPSPSAAASPTPSAVAAPTPSAAAAGRRSRLCSCPRGPTREDQHAWHRRTHLCHALHHVTNPSPHPSAHQPHHQSHHQSQHPRLTGSESQRTLVSFVVLRVADAGH